MIQLGRGLSHRIPLSPMRQGLGWVLIAVADAWTAGRLIDHPRSQFRIRKAYWAAAALVMPSVKLGADLR